MANYPLIILLYCICLEFSCILWNVAETEYCIFFGPAAFVEIHPAQVKLHWP